MSVSVEQGSSHRRPSACLRLVLSQKGQSALRSSPPTRHTPSARSPAHNRFHSIQAKAVLLLVLLMLLLLFVVVVAAFAAAAVAAVLVVFTLSFPPLSVL